MHSEKLLELLHVFSLKNANKYINVKNNQPIKKNDSQISDLASQNKEHKFNFQHALFEVFLRNPRSSDEQADII